jgi:hypothetical protein
MPYIQPDEIDDMDEIDDDAFLTEKDYLEILAEIEDGELYDDEDVYNMYLLEKEELALINQEGCDDYDGDTVFEYAQVYETFGTGFGEETIVFNDYCDAPLKSDTKSSSPLSRSLDKLTRPIISFKNKITSSPTFSRPLQTLASSYKDMLMLKGKM